MKAIRVFPCWLCKPLLLCAVSISAGTLKAQQSAALIDWAPTDRSSNSQGCVQFSQAECQSPFFCTGSYLEPDWLEQFRNDDPDTSPIHATGERGDRDAEGTITLVGDVQIQQGYRNMKTEIASLNKEEDRAWFEGDVQIREPGLLMTGARGYSTLSTGEGNLEEATFLLHEGRLRGQAETLAHTPDDHILILNGLFTRCEPGSNVWQMRGREIDLDPQVGFGTARDLTLRIKGVPVAYSPYFRFPIDDERHSGFLSPSLSHDGDGGVDISVPYYFNLARHYDITYTPRSVWKRGLHNTVQFRFMTAASSNEFNAAYLYHDDIFDDRILLDRTGGEDRFIEEFKQQSRWFVNVRHTGGWTGRLKTNLRYSAVSDFDYLDDFGGDVDSVAVEQFLSKIDKSIGNIRAGSLDRQASVNYRGDGWDTGLRLQGFQDLVIDTPENYEQLPRLHFNSSGGNKWLQYKLNTDYVYFDKNNEDLAGNVKVIGHRVAVDAKITSPLRRVWGFLKPSLAIKHRLYELKNTTPSMNPYADFTVPVFSLDGGLFFDRFFSTAGLDLQQTLEPRLFYLYAKETEQGALPLFDAAELTRTYSQLFRDARFAGKDRVGDARHLSAGVTTRFIDHNTGVQYLSASIGQTYFFMDRTISLLPGDPEANSSALFGQIGISPIEALRISGSLEWEHHNGKTSRGTLGIRYSPDYLHILNITYRFTSEDIQIPTIAENVEESDITFIWPIKGKLSAIGRWNFGWDNDQTIESFVGVEYNDCCWKMRLVFRRFLKDPRNIIILEDDPGAPGGVRQVPHLDNRADTGVFFEFQLKGLATMGRRLDSLLDDAIIGYREREDHFEM
jgi:LPS-assembly protein|tara:strand:- start:1867 stop:4395 length:2529 start_codon:yes stop_codon:yes gene_type:complete